MNIPTDLLYAESHEWFRASDGAVGITDYAQDSMGDLVYIELPQVGDTFKKGDTMVVIESVKATSDIYAPVDGTVNAINEALVDQPELVNQDSYAAWMVKLVGAQPEGLMDAAAYEQQILAEQD